MKDFPVLPQCAARHLKVVRPRDGEAVELFDGCGAKRVYRYGAASHSLGDPSDRIMLPRSDPLTLFACVTKGSRWDWTVEKAVELGVTRIVPVISERTIVRIAPSDREAKRDRWTRIAEDAARQSDAVWLPEISPVTDFADTLALVKETECFVGALTDPPAPPLLEAVRKAPAVPARGFAAYIGPEGDFTSAELSSLLEIATPASFGPNILRAETAAIFAVAVLAAAREKAYNISNG
ncbi:MAG: 16S rRNA (uracil(1498)-N(3))-methyltransferase [Kiritimatiellae bacterium]|nr:16S rRNA (uracil(1498)-N(3))-methyltransferase [Kiritimatiellia bacterium]